MNNKKINIFSIIMIILLVLINLAHLLWTVWLTIEQVKTGFGFGTNMELGVLYPWLTEILSSPVIITEIIYIIISIFKKPKKSLLVTNICLFGAVILQYLITNLFIWY